MAPSPWTWYLFASIIRQALKMIMNAMDCMDEEVEREEEKK